MPEPLMRWVVIEPSSRLLGEKCMLCDHKILVGDAVLFRTKAMLNTRLYIAQHKRCLAGLMTEAPLEATEYELDARRQAIIDSGDPFLIGACNG